MQPSVRYEHEKLLTLRDNLRGSIIVPTDNNYDAARKLWNGRFNPRPAAIIRCAGTADVITTLKFCRQQDLPVSVRGGGHSYAGNTTGDGALMIDLSAMRGIRVDPKGKSARVQAGATCGDFDCEAQAFGLATTTGTVSSIGIAGLTLGGGSGYLVRKHGLTIDNLISADVVTAQGEFINASKEQHEDLFWALRGGGGNFGIATSFEYKLHQVGPNVLAGQVIYPLDQTQTVLEGYRELMLSAPDEVQCYAFFFRLPQLPAFPENYQGKVVLDLVLCYAGDLAHGEQVLKPFSRLGTPIVDAIGPVSYVQLQKSFDAGLPAGQRYYSKAHNLHDLSADVVELVLQYVEKLKGDYTSVYFDPGGGAINLVDPAATAFPHRSATLGFHILAGWGRVDEDETVMSWAGDFYDALIPHSTGGVYVNLIADDEDDRVRAAYGSNYQRLAELKKKWDPENLFRYNHNISRPS